MPKTLKTNLTKGIFTIELARPEVRNAFNDVLISDLQKTFEKIEKDSQVRAVILRGQGPVFCAGGDLNWMRQSIGLSPEDNLKDTQKLAKMFDTLNRCSRPVIGLVHGAALGGGVGLVSICDYVICTKDTVFSLSEVRLGIVPACIGPFVLAKIGETHARAYFISAERFKADKAQAIGLVHEVVKDEKALGKACDRLITNLLQCGPKAMIAAKTLIHTLKEKNFEDGLDYAACMLADLRVTPEGQEGLKAFLEKRKPNWIK